ncbi:hypothetical protein C3747_4g337 [Trypanosoma cruzi]|uniref:Uncharacterized protein n=1 Tax=Trypanosoma cruzi TaxID=5693 RepID=A0A2V2XLS8_TRYCR|nr:hypothetical protein C3747_4g337 [Trypanosoma cruzi]RNC40042.1 hypothetical protein TcCL_NonESM10528 [Trypanosoma cruzi]
MPPSMHGKAATSIRFREMLLLMDYYASVTLLGHPTTTFARLLPSIEFFPWDTVSCSGVRFYQPLFAEDASDDVGRTAFYSTHSSLGDCDFELWTDGPSCLAALASGSAALLYDSTTTNDLPVEVHRAAAGSLACSYGAGCLAIENVFRHLVPPCPGASQSPTRMLEEADSLSAMEAPRVAHRPCETALLSKFGLCCFPW